jgi:hypothetical protein
MCGLLLLLEATRGLSAEPTQAAISALNAYSAAVELRLVRQHSEPRGFLAPWGGGSNDAIDRVRRGEPVIERVSEPSERALHAALAGAMLHDWRGTAFAQGAKAADFERLMRDFNAYPQHFAPQVVEARACGQRGDQIHAWMRIRQHHVVTVVMDTAYDIAFGELDARHGYSIAHSTRVEEIASPGTRAERRLTADEEHGFLWRLNTYWSYEERDGGLYLQIEAVSLTRSIPNGLGWAIGPYVESIPRESLEFTLSSAVKALHK